MKNLLFTLVFAFISTFVIAQNKPYQELPVEFFAMTGSETHVLFVGQSPLLDIKHPFPAKGKFFIEYREDKKINTFVFPEQNKRYALFDDGTFEAVTTFMKTIKKLKKKSIRKVDLSVEFPEFWQYCQNPK